MDGADKVDANLPVAGLKSIARNSDLQCLWLIAVIFWLLVRPAPVEGQSSGSDLALLKRLLRNKYMWLVSLSWFLWVSVQSSMYTFYPTYLTEEIGFTMIKADLMVYAMSLFPSTYSMSLKI